MAGSLKIYSDPGYATEMPSGTDAYIIDFGTMDGTVGSNKTILLYCKNVGDQTLESRSIAESSDAESLQSYSVDNVSFSPSTLALANLAAGATQIVYLKVTIPAGMTNAGNPRNITFEIKGASI